MNITKLHFSMSLSLRFLSAVSVWLGIFLFSSEAFAAPGSIAYAQVSCSGEAIIRTTVGQFEKVQVERNLPGCIGSETTTTQTVTQPAVVDYTTPLTTTSHETIVTPTPVTTTSTPTQTIIPTSYTTRESTGVLLDLTSADIGNYRTDELKDQGVRYANPVYSVRMREQASAASDTEAYLLKNDAVVVEDTIGAWSKAQGAEIQVTDTVENTTIADTTGRADGYIVSRWLREPTQSDLVRIGQADPVYWSDIAHVQVAHLVNVRAEASATSKIVTSLTNGTKVYIVSTVNNWSEVISEDRSLHGYIRSDFLVVEKYQRVDPAPLLR